VIHGTGAKNECFEWHPIAITTEEKAVSASRF
jgi:hypothetical protein